MRARYSCNERNIPLLMGLRLSVVEGTQEGCTGWIGRANDFTYTSCGDAHVLLSVDNIYDNEKRQK